MKKIIALTLVLILAVGLFAGCKSSDKGSVYFLNFKPEADVHGRHLPKRTPRRPALPSRSSPPPAAPMRPR